MIAFIEMGRDRRTYRFFQDTLHGRVLIAESPQIDTIVAAVTNYVARRLVERERALAAEAADPEKRGPANFGRRAAPDPGVATAAPDGAAARPAPPRPTRRTLAAGSHRRTVGQRPRRRAQLSSDDARLDHADSACSPSAGYLAWTLRARDWWAHWFGQPPF